MNAYVFCRMAEGPNQVLISVFDIEKHSRKSPTALQTDETKWNIK